MMPGMTRDEIALVRESFDRLRPIPKGVGRAFYETLFALDPSLKPLFKGDLDAQGAMFVSALGLAVAGIDDAHFFRVDNIEKAAADIPADRATMKIWNQTKVGKKSLLA